MIPLPIATGFYEDSTRPIAAQECSNWHPQVPETNALTRIHLKATPGLKLFSESGTKICRGLWVMGGIAYSVNGSKLYRVNPNGTSTDLGDITGVTRVSMANNAVGELCVVVPGVTAYIYSVAGGLVEITDPDFTDTLGPSQQVVFKDGYFVHYNNDSNASDQPIFFISNLNQGLVFDALDFGTAESDPDDITGIHVNRNLLYVGGENNIEPFQNIGGSGFPFQTIRGGIIQKGVDAKSSLIDYDNSFVFVGGGIRERAAVWKYAGNSSIKISTSSIENIIQQLSAFDINNIFSTTYAEDGGFFLNIHLRERTFTYDAAASALAGKPMWHEKKSKTTEGLQTNWRVNHIAEAYGLNLAGDNQSGRTGELDNKTYTEYGVSIKRVVASTPFNNQGERVKVSKLELMCESGTANRTGAGSDPHVSREFSDDGGYTFGFSTKRSLGKQGDYKKRQIWRKDGQFEDSRVYRFIHDEPIKASILGLRGSFR